MSHIMKVFLLLAVIICISTAQMDRQSGRCLCERVRNKIRSMSNIKEVKIYQATIFCDRVEIVVTDKNGFRYCLNPELGAVRKFLASIVKPTTTA
ncbi:hypothetical protein ABVT39_015527 [Epinephelus coioides]